MIFDILYSDGAASQYKNNYNIMNLSLHEEDFGIKAVWTFTSSGHGKSPCDGLGAVVKSAARKHLLKGGPERAFSSAKDFYKFTLQKNSQISSQAKSADRNKSSNSTSNLDSGDLSDEETDTIAAHSTNSIEVRWLDSEEVEEIFQKVLKTRWNQLSTKSNPLILSEPFTFFNLL
jgi:hypothetical protein